METQQQEEQRGMTETHFLTSQTVSKIVSALARAQLFRTITRSQGGPPEVGGEGDHTVESSQLPSFTVTLAMVDSGINPCVAS